MRDEARAVGGDDAPILANPQASIEVGEQTIAVRARFAEGEEREEIWTAQKLAAPGMAEYELKTDRVMPVVILEPS